MATIRKRGTRWQAQVRIQDHAPVSKSFLQKADAEAWARQQEVEIERGDIQNSRRSLKAYSLADLLARYEAEITAKKRGAASECYRLKSLRRTSLAALTLDKLTSSAIAKHRDERLICVAAPTVRRELVILRHCLEVARKEWGVPLVGNPLDAVRKPENGKARTRRVTDADAQRLAHGLLSARNNLSDIIHFAIATGMRRGELLALTWTDVDLEARTALLTTTKNGEPRLAPLSPEALKVLRRQVRNDGENRVFPASGNAVRLAWERLKKRAGVENLRFHDLRHEAISRFFELGLSTVEVATISGHKDTRMLMRYTHLRAETIAQKMDKLSRLGATEDENSI